MPSTFLAALERHRKLFADLPAQEGLFARLADDVEAALRAGGKIMLFGNGGSAADAQHIAAEFVVRFKTERRALAAIALTVDTSILTAHSNDYGFATVFARQIEALGRPGDIAFGYSTSGNSENVIEGIRAARAAGIASWAWTGAGGGRLAGEADHLIAVPATETARIQEAHLFIAHWLCEEMDRRFSA